MSACDPRALLLQTLDRFPFSPDQQFNVIAAGKAAAPMAAAFAERFAARTRGRVVSRGGHPLPDAESFAAGERALALAGENRGRGDTLVVLLSGGASAMLAAPAAGVALEQKIAVTRDLLRSGRPIAEINAVRTGLSAIKGGRLGASAGRSVTFAISDVHAPVEDDPAVIGSGPTVSNPPNPEARYVVIGSRRDAMRGARDAAERLGYAVHLVGPPVIGEARVAAGFFAARAGELAASRSGPVCLLASGETTVTLPERHGLGGRNQEFTLACALELAGQSDYVLASVGTDGIDGPTDAAGAIADGMTLARADDMGLDARRALETHDTYPFFAALGDRLITGPTGTNVGDLMIFLAG